MSGYYNPNNMVYKQPGTQFNLNAPVFVPRFRQNQPQQFQPQPQLYYHQNPMMNQFNPGRFPISNGYQPPVAPYGLDLMRNAPAPAVPHHVPVQEQEYDGGGGYGYPYPMYEEAPGQRYMPSAELQTRMERSPSSMKLNEIIVGLEQILADNEGFAAWAGAIRERVASETPEFRLLAVQIMCEMAVVTMPSSTPGSFQNAQYSIARILAYLSDEIPDLLGDHIINVLQSWLDQKSAFAVEKKCTLLSFFAESYAQIMTESHSKINALGTAVLDQISDIFKVHQQLNDDVVKVILYVLKMVGRDLDSFSEGEQKMNSVLTTFSAYGRGHPKLSDSLKTQITSLIDSRQKGWRTKERHYVNQEGSMLDLNDEECEFLDRCMPGEETGDSSIDDDVAAEYDLFRKEEEMNRTVHNLDCLNIDSQNSTAEVATSQQNKDTNEKN